MHARFIALFGQPRNPFCLSLPSVQRCLITFSFSWAGRSARIVGRGRHYQPRRGSTKSVDRKDFREIVGGVGSVRIELARSPSLR